MKLAPEIQKPKIRKSNTKWSDGRRGSFPCNIAQEDSQCTSRKFIFARELPCLINMLGSQINNSFLLLMI